MRTAPTPDIDGMVNRGQDRLRRRNTMRIGLAAATVLLVGGGIYGVTQIGDSDPDSAPDIANTPSDTASEASVPTNWESINEEPVAPGTYRTYVGLDADAGTIEADMTFDGSNWSASNYPVAYDGARFAGFGVYRPDWVAAGCGSEAGRGEAAAAEPQALAQQFAGMPRSTVLQEPSPTEAFGYAALHLRVRVNAWCGGDPTAYQVADANSSGRGISYFDKKPEGPAGIVIIDFWVVDVDGTTVVVDMFHTQDAPKVLVDQAARARESITFVFTE